MTARFSRGKLLKLAGLDALIAAMATVAGRGASTTTNEKQPSTRSSEPGLRTEITSYVVGYGLALTFTVAAFALVHWQWVLFPTALWIVFGLALAQIVVHFRCFLHISLRQPARDDLQLILFSTLIVLLMVGGTLVVMFNLRLRMM